MVAVPDPVGVGIDESRIRDVPTDVHDGHVLARKRQHLVAIADRGHGPVLDEHGLRHGRLVHRHDPADEDHRIRIRRRPGCRPAARRGDGSVRQVEPWLRGHTRQSPRSPSPLPTAGAIEGSRRRPLMPPAGVRSGSKVTALPGTGGVATPHPCPVAWTAFGRWLELDRVEDGLELGLVGGCRGVIDGRREDDPAGRPVDDGYRRRCARGAECEVVAAGGTGPDPEGAFEASGDVQSFGRGDVEAHSRASADRDLRQVRRRPSSAGHGGRQRDRPRVGPVRGGLSWLAHASGYTLISDA